MKIHKDKVKKINIKKSADELSVQFSFVKKNIRNLLSDFIKTTDSSLVDVRRAGDNGFSVNKNVDQAREKIKSSAKHLEDSVESLLGQWKKEVRQDIKNPDKYDDAVK